MISVLRTAVFAMALFAAGAAAAAAPGNGKDEQSMLYSVYAGGIHAVQARLDVNYTRPDRYDIELAAATRGFLQKLVPWDGSFESAGWRLKDGEFRPEMHRSVSSWDSEEEEKDYRYGRDGSFKSYKVIEQGKDKTPEKLDRDLTHDTTDALSAALTVMQRLSSGKPCAGESEVFDGDRRYSMIFREKQRDMLVKTDYNVYEGPAIMCEVEIRPGKGRWHEKPRGWLSIQEQGRQHGSLPVVWMATLKEGAPAVPVKVRIKTNYGTLFAHLTGYVSGPSAKK